MTVKCKWLGNKGCRFDDDQDRSYKNKVCNVTNFSILRYKTIKIHKIQVDLKKFEYLMWMSRSTSP